MYSFSVSSSILSKIINIFNKIVFFNKRWLVITLINQQQANTKWKNNKGGETPRGSLIKQF